LVGGRIHKHKQYGCKIKKTKKQEETKWTKEKDYLDASAPFILI
jgi:hypothetical protein